LQNLTHTTGSGSNGEGTTFFELTVSSAGEVEQCRVIQSSGIAVFDHLTCSLMGKRARFRPATDQNGQAIASTWSNRVKWVKPGHDISVTPPPPAIEVMVSRLPPKISSPVSAGVLAVIGLHGEVEACTGQNIAFPAALNTLACQQLQRTMPSVIARDNKGDARRILRFFWVRFSAPTQAPSR
jgi:TonB family protein